MNPDNTATMQKDEDININERIKDYFQKETGCTVNYSWGSTFLFLRFYFEEKECDGWRYILDIDRDDLDESEIMADLIKAKWQDVLKDCSGKRVPCFTGKKFATFHEWPKSSERAGGKSGH